MQSLRVLESMISKICTFLSATTSPAGRPPGHRQGSRRVENIAAQRGREGVGASCNTERNARGDEAREGGGLPDEGGRLEAPGKGGREEGSAPVALFLARNTVENLPCPMTPMICSPPEEPMGQPCLAGYKSRRPQPCARRTRVGAQAATLFTRDCPLPAVNRIMTQPEPEGLRKPRPAEMVSAARARY